MATVVLSAVGAIVGGPIGAAVGAVIGQQVDNVIFAPPRRQGPRLGDLTVQTSSYGSMIPKLFGTVRVSGTVIWATDLKESRTTRSNGKGRGSTDVYSYSASFAVALSARSIENIGRIWADGKLLRGAAGDFKSETGFRFYTGDEGQVLDPLMAASEGIGATPAYRGLAYVVFEDMALAGFGNRIPSISFEVIADSAGTSAGAVLSGLGAIASDGGPALTGLAATGDSVRGVAETLLQVMPFSTVVESGVLNARFGAGPLRVVASDDRGASADKKAVALSTDRMAAAAIPEIVTLAYNDVARDYLVGAQRAKRDAGARREVRLDLPAALEAGSAKAIAEARLVRMWAERSRATVTLPWRALTVDPGDRVTVPGLSGIWRVARVTFESMVVRLDLVLLATAGLIAPVADPGRNRPQVDVPHGPTTLQVIDLPQLTDVPESAPLMVVAANGASGGWRRAVLTSSIDGGATYADAGSTALPAVIGQTLTPLFAGATALIDRTNTVDVQLIHAGLSFNDADDAALLGGANLAMIGDEALQFGRADPLGNGRWRLSELWRGRRGTEWAAADLHPAASAFVLVEPNTLAPLTARASVGGVHVMAIGVGDQTGVVATGPNMVGTATRPLTPIGLKAQSSGNDVVIAWTRRSRDGWRWSDGVDAPLAEENERYRVIKTAVGRPDVVNDVTAPTWTYTAAERAADFAAGALTASISVAQIGSRGLSRPVAIGVSIN
jgi:Putative phage tail protein